jgi:hypothetical protein
MKTEFNLSEKRYRSIDGVDFNGDDELSIHYSEENVKEFIRLLKEEFNHVSSIRFINKLAGDKLI